jgi:transposase
MMILPRSIEDYVAKDDPVRAYDAFVEKVDLEELGITINDAKVGNSQYDPRAMVKLLLYGYSYGIKSSRKLERECHHNMSFIWLMGGLKPDHKTIAEFRRKNKKALKKLLKLCAQVCIKLNLVAGNVLFVDGTKIKANASINRTHDKAYYEKQLEALDRRIDELLDECEAVDVEEEGSPSFVAMPEELKKTETLREKIKKALEICEREGKTTVNLTDPDCAVMKSVQGSHPSYNVQSVVDDEHGLIVHVDAVSDANDLNQFARQIESANELFEKPCDIACADAGYADTEELEKVAKQGTTVVVPSKRQALHEEESPFSKSHFIYDKENDCYYCPEGHRLSYRSTNKKTGKRYYRITRPGICRGCRHYGKCTSLRKGRKVTRLKNEEAKQHFEKLYEREDLQEIYRRRKGRVEHPFGHIKRNLKTDSFHLRGREGVRAEIALLATCFNIRRMITIFGGVIQFIEKLMGIGMVTVPG